ncbi:MAG: hypothetical protein C0501_21210 [Isosphaera sp.]|nr:hypothetical protein [Isosphaera sp.]
MFFKAFTRLVRGAAPSDPVPPEVLRDLARIETFPTLSDTTVRALALVHDPDADLAALAALIRRDAVVSVSLLKAANSVLYRGRRDVEDVRDATVRLGLWGCHRVLAAVGTRGLFRHRNPAAKGACDGLFRHALFTATLATKLNAAAGLGFRGEEFTAGLLHDIGRVIVCVRAPDAFFRADPMTFDEDGGVLGREREVLHIDHCEVGARFAKANALPASVAGAILNHHFPKAEPEHRGLVALVALADGLANHVQRERKLAGYVPEQRPEFVLLGAAFGRETAADLRAAINPAVVQALRETRAMLRLTAD